RLQARSNLRNFFSTRPTTRRAIARTFLIAALVVSMSQAGAGANAQDADAKMTAEEREKALKLLDDSEREFLSQIEGVSDAQWSYHNSPFQWSVGQIAEHIVLAQDAIFAIVRNSLEGKPDPDWRKKTEGKEAVLQRVLPERVGRASAPRPLIPKGKMTRQEIIERFK